MEHHKCQWLLRHNLACTQVRLSLLCCHQNNPGADRADLLWRQLWQRSKSSPKRTIKDTEFGWIQVNRRRNTRDFLVFVGLLTNRLTSIVRDGGFQFSRQNQLEANVCGQCFQLTPRLILLHGLGKRLIPNNFDGLSSPGFGKVRGNPMERQFLSQKLG